MRGVLSQQKAVQSPRLSRVLPTPPSQEVKSKGRLTSFPIQSNTRHFPNRCKNSSLPAKVQPALQHVWTITLITPSGKYHHSLQHQVALLPI